MNPTITTAELAALQGKRQAGTSKYRNVRTEVDGIMFDSKREAERYKELHLLQRAGEIRHLETQVKLHLHVNGVHVCDYVADFTYQEFDKNDAPRLVVEDVKGYRTDVYRLKKKLMLACHGIEIQEVK